LFVFIVEARKGLGVEDTVVATVVDPGVVLNTDDVGRLITRLGESWEGKEASGNSIWRKLMSFWTLESYNTLRLLFAVGNLVRVITNMNFRGVGKALIARGLVGNSKCTLEECSLTPLSYWIDSVLVEAAGG